MLSNIPNTIWGSLFSLLLVSPLTYFYPAGQAGPLSYTVLSRPVLAEHQISLDDRYPNASVNQVFKDNILLTLHYLNGSVSVSDKPDWNQVLKQPVHYQFTLNPQQVFAFHDDILPEYQGSVEKTTNATFNYQQGFKSDGYLYGDGVCHIASLMDWVAQDANLEVNAPTNHNFAVIPEIDKKYGVAIYYAPGYEHTDEENNLYIKNTKNYPVNFVFDYSNDELKLSLIKEVN